VIHLPLEHGLQDAVKERLLRAYFTEGEAVGDRDTLVRLAAEAGLDADEVRAALEEQRYAGAVRADEAEAQALGLSGVPFFVVDRRYGAAGAQPAELLLQILQKAWAEANPHLTELARSGGSQSTVPAADGCTDDSCAV
jgi:predicted DsbA family dithiol-disulfide isomerase